MNNLFNYFKKVPRKVEECEDLPEPECPYECGDIVWCKLGNWPWWPAIVDESDKDKKLVRRSGKAVELHVQFLDEEWSTSWIDLRDVEKFSGEDADQKPASKFYSTDRDRRLYFKLAQKVVKQPKEGRIKFAMEQADNKENGIMEVDEASKKRKSEASSRSGRTKRRRVLIESDSDDDNSEDEYEPSARERKAAAEEDDDDSSSGEDEANVSEPSTDDEPEESPIKKARPTPKIKAKTPIQSQLTGLKSTPSRGTPNGNATPSGTKRNTDSTTSATPTTTPLTTPITPRTPVSETTKARLANFTANDTVDIRSSCADGIVYKHQTYEFLKPENIRDKDKHRPDHPEYCPRTLHVPESFLKQQTPALKQWWILKADHFDTVLFFKLGKFYEMYHMDSDIGVEHLGLIYMRGEMAHSGFPEVAFQRYADLLVSKGFKVARVEQTETPDQMNERMSGQKGPKVVRREICAITTLGTQKASLSGDSQTNLLLAIAAKQQSGGSRYGVCLADTTRGRIELGHFTDDRHLSRLRTLLAHHPPAQVLLERGKVPTEVTTLLRQSSAKLEYLVSGSEFWSDSETLRQLAESKYWGERSQWPTAVTNMLSQTDSLGLSAAEDYSLAVSSLGAVTWYLRYCLMDEDILSMRNIETYIPPDSSTNLTTPGDGDSRFNNPRQRLVLDGVTLDRLGLVTGDGNLLQVINHCATRFGERLLQQWLCAPLVCPSAIEVRQDAVAELIHTADSELGATLKKLPDLERLLARIHSLGLASRSVTSSGSDAHPDARAVMFEESTYSRRKIEDFLSGLSGFRTCQTLMRRLAQLNFSSDMLKKTVTLQKDGGNFPDLTELLSYFDEAFDHKKAKAEGAIVPSPGVDAEYDEASREIEETERDLEEYLNKQKRELNCKKLVYWGSGKNRYQIEVPQTVSVPHSYDLMSQRKGFKRYRTARIEQLLSVLVQAEDRKSIALKDVMRRIFNKFSSSYESWSSAVGCVSVLDVLQSLATYSRRAGMCRPQVLQPRDKAWIELRSARHPCLAESAVDFIPNDTLIGVENSAEAGADEGHDDSCVVLVTGPNMGGKSTLMRQVGLITVLAQLGSYVPADSCRLTPVDRIFTRIGASDRITAGESTFYVEMSETCSLLRHSTRDSLLLLDELGRGTVTYDGQAIASAVVESLATKVGCRTLFSTHYHGLVDAFASHPRVRLGHMACMVESEVSEESAESRDESDESPSSDCITFLYRFVPGACPKSHGFNAARLACLPTAVIRNGLTQAARLELEYNKRKLFRSLMAASEDDIQELYSQVATAC